MMKNSESHISHKNDHTREEARAELLFLEEKYERVKKKLYQKKLLGELKDIDMDEIGNLMNIIAMKYSQEGQQKVAEDWLRRVLKHIQHSSRLIIITYNNLACVYRQSDNLPMALLYIQKAQKEADITCLESADDATLKVVTDCSLNLCAILSSMQQHYRALKAAKKALKLLMTSPNIPEAYRSSLYPIIKYNEGVEYERLKLFDNAHECYTEAIRSPGITQQLTLRVQEALQSVKKQSDSQVNSRFTKRKSLPSRAGTISNSENTNPPTLPTTARKSLVRNRKISEKFMNYFSSKDTANKPKPKVSCSVKNHDARVLGELENY